MPYRVALTNQTYGDDDGALQKALRALLLDASAIQLLIRRTKIQY